MRRCILLGCGFSSFGLRYSLRKPGNTVEGAESCLSSRIVAIPIPVPYFAAQDEPLWVIWADQLIPERTAFSARTGIGQDKEQWPIAQDARPFPVLAENASSVGYSCLRPSLCGGVEATCSQALRVQFVGGGSSRCHIVIRSTLDSLTQTALLALVLTLKE